MDSQSRPHYRLLTEDQIQEIHLATLDILETIGVKILGEEGIELLEGAGCRVTQDKLVNIPRDLVEECIESAPSRLPIYNRKGEAAMDLQGHQSYFGTGTDLLQTLDLETGQMRPSRLQDVANAALVGDYFKEIDFIASSAHPQDVPANLSYVASFKALVENSSKPIFFTAAGSEDLSIIIDLAAAVAGGEEVLRAETLSHPLRRTDKSPLSLLWGFEKTFSVCRQENTHHLYPCGSVRSERSCDDGRSDCPCQCGGPQRARPPPVEIEGSTHHFRICCHPHGYANRHLRLRKPGIQVSPFSVCRSLSPLQHSCLGHSGVQ